MEEDTTVCSVDCREKSGGVNARNRTRLEREKCDDITFADSLGQNNTDLVALQTHAAWDACRNSLPLYLSTTSGNCTKPTRLLIRHCEIEVQIMEACAHSHRSTMSPRKSLNTKIALYSSMPSIKLWLNTCSS